LFVPDQIRNQNASGGSAVQHRRGLGDPADIKGSLGESLPTFARRVARCPKLSIGPATHTQLANSPLVERIAFATNGQNLREFDHTVNSLNQYSQWTVPATFDVLGVARVTSTVTVNSQTTSRKGEYFWKQLTASNGSAPDNESVTVSVSGVTPEVERIEVSPAVRKADGTVSPVFNRLRKLAVPDLTGRVESRR